MVINSKFIGLVFLLTAAFLANTNAIAQHKIYWGIDGGIAIYKTKVENFNGDYFQPKKIVSLAPTGLTLGIEFNKHWLMEVAASFQTFTSDHISYYDANDQSGFESSGSGYDAINFSGKLKYQFYLGKSFFISPFLGLQHITINQPSLYTSPYELSTSGSSTSNGVLVYDSTYSETLYYTNRLLSPEVGFEFAFKIDDRINFCTNFTYMINPEDYSVQHVDYFKTGQDVRRGLIYYGGSGVYIQIGIKWHWRDNLKPDTYKLKEESAIGK